MTHVQPTAVKCDHTSVGMLVWKADRLLLIERRRPPFGFAPPAGHVDDRPSYEDAARAELKEEVGLDVVGLELVAEGRKDNPCRRADGTWHYWKIFRVEATGQVTRSPDETKQFRWCSRDQLRGLSEKTRLYVARKISDAGWIANPGLEPVWFEWLSELKIL